MLLKRLVNYETSGSDYQNGNGRNCVSPQPMLLSIGYTKKPVVYARCRYQIPDANFFGSVVMRKQDWQSSEVFNSLMKSPRESFPTVRAGGWKSIWIIISGDAFMQKKTT